ncbi:MAG: prolyl oligopeptidase family serine peptidase [Chloroflexi bacterium]|nr:prolyl oligopeptidase family serine peptidase [Chloroflexota bacterium]
MKPVGQIQYFQSPVDNQLHPCAVCATDTSDAPKPLLLQVNPGGLKDLAADVALAEEIATIAARHGLSCVVLRPTGRGPGSVYQNYGEVDVLEAIEHVAAHYPIDRDRISITGSSMGGAAVWYLISHYPDLFAGAAPFCGYCDYRLWEKPGGMTFHLNPWEEPSWQSRSAAFLVENLEHTPVWMVHGEWDRSIGGGVSVEHSRHLARLMQAQGFPYTYTEVPRIGHYSNIPEIWDQLVPWLLEQKKRRNPDHVALATYNLRHNRSYWTTIDQLEYYGTRGMVDAGFTDRHHLVVRTDNIRTFSLKLDPARNPLSIVIDGQDLGTVHVEPGETGRSQTFRRTHGLWTAGVSDLSQEKHHGASGPIGDLFFDGLILVPGTAGTEEETFFTSWVARHAQTYYRSRNGGVHRGGIMGENFINLPIINDVDLAPDILANHNLLLYGTPASNAVLARFAADLPLDFSATATQLGDKRYTASRTAVFAIFPHPGNPARYIAVHGGMVPDAISWGSHLDMHLLPDYLVYAEGELLDWGFWGNDWQHQAGK